MATGIDLHSPNGPLIEVDFHPAYTEEQLGRALSKPRVIVLSDGMKSFDVFVKDRDFIWYTYWVPFFAGTAPSTEQVLDAWYSRRDDWKPFDTKKSTEDEHAWRMSL